MLEVNLGADHKIRYSKNKNFNPPFLFCKTCEERFTCLALPRP